MFWVTKLTWYISIVFVTRLGMDISTLLENLHVVLLKKIKTIEAKGKKEICQKKSILILLQKNCIPIFASTLLRCLTDKCKDVVFSFEYKVLTDHAGVIHNDTTDNTETDHDYCQETVLLTPTTVSN